MSEQQKNEGLNPQQQKLVALVDKIKNTRTQNNANWMGLLEIAVIYAPKQALSCLQGIRECDAGIHDDFCALVDELEKAAQ